MVVIIPADEVHAESSWWKGIVALTVGGMVGFASAALCFGAFVPAAPTAAIVCPSVGGFMGTFVASLLKAALDGESLGDYEPWVVAFAEALVAGLGAGAWQKWLQPCAKANMHTVLQKAGEAVSDAGAAVAKWAGAGITKGAAAVAGFLEGASAIIWEKMLAAARKAGFEVLAASDLRVMPLGDSITYGVGSPTKSSYRSALWDRLDGQTKSLDFVGSAQSGQLPDIDHEGHPGWRIDEIADVAGCNLPHYRPNVVTLHIGTNDMNQNLR
ncbi:hypothetical protein HRW23_30040 [Streptomyces lunaelactis]|uniref:GDSL-type esterase/lipase family protein n=1 Tax=Streptomyces lunaelactis TaxID=1535768 RepID=UPI001584C433|nr:hypothetical protein [Streptomyces lunaelactis]NUK15321.1 hypothetical protein [Streptomyces lunaelactis]NUK32660.1 hypothetical protein [Streptomyces lunaelactis]NUK40892.1 hypothetical protein [Streptomyces lunaelactis]NUK69637.1 hypothetical protein [Streptomyces lunaelactis]